MTRARNIAGFSTITTTPSPVNVGPIGVLTATRIDGEFGVVDLNTRDITAQGIGVTNLQVSGITTGLNVSGIITAQNGINFNGTSTGLNVSGVSTTVTLNATTLSVSGNATISGNADIGGVLTYEDVTRVDSVGIITARSGVVVTGVTTTTQLKVTTGANAFETSANVFKGTAGQKGVYLRSALSAAATPSYSSVDDTNTGIFLPGSDVFAVTTGGTERLRITGDGPHLLLGGTDDVNEITESSANAGMVIGSTSYGNAGLAIITSTSGTGRLYFGDAIGSAAGRNVGQINYGHSDNHMRFVTASTERVRITSNGDFGVATSSPAQKLHVYGNSGTTAIALGDNSTTQPYMLLEANETDNLCTVHSRTNNPLTFKVNNSERMRLNTSGQFLINTTDGTGAYNLVVCATNNSDTGMTFRGTTASQQRIRFADGTSGGAESIGQVEYNHADNSLAIDTNGAEAVRIDSSGRVMIQTTTEGHADSDDLTIGDTSDNRIGITLRSSEYGNIFFSDATSGTAEYQGVLQYHHTDNVFNLNIGGPNKVTVGANNIALFGADNISSRGINYYGVDLAYKGSGIQGRSDNPTLDLCSNVYHDGSSGFKYGEGNTTAGQLSLGGNQILYYSAASGTAGASATMTERFRFNPNNILIFGSSTSNAASGSVHIANAFLRLQAAQQTSLDFSQEVGIEWSQESGSDVQVGKIVMRRTAWGGAPHSMDFYSRNSSNQVLRSMTIDHDGGIYFQRLLGNASGGSTVKYSNSDKELRYDTSSKLLKTNITELTKYGIDTVKNLKPCTFTPQEYNEDGTITVGNESLIGFLADEMVTEVPEVVQMYPKSTLTKQEADTEVVPAAISYDKLTVVLTKALQEAIAKIETLEAKVAALEGS